jgi:hypothetical protein
LDLKSPRTKGKLFAPLRIRAVPGTQQRRSVGLAMLAADAGRWLNGMNITDDIAKGLGVALNESSLIGVEYSDEYNCVAATFSVLTLPDDHAPEPKDPRIQIVFYEIGRIAASLRNGYWNEYDAEIVNFEIGQLLSIVELFGGQPIYGWEFFNIEDEEFPKWRDRLSLDFTNSNGSQNNFISLFQEGSSLKKHLDLWIWFESLKIFNAKNQEIKTSSFIRGGERWWDALHNRDQRTDSHGIFPSND